MSNPAARLHAILVRAVATNNPSNSTPDAWKDVLKLPAAIEPLSVMSKVGLLYALPDLIAKEIGRFPDLDPELYLGWRTDLANAFAVVGFQMPSSEFRGRLTNSLLTNIRFCSQELEKRIPEKEVSAEHLQAIREAATALYDEVLKLDLSPHLSRFLLDHLWLIIDAVDKYQITGAPGLQTSIDAIVGATVTDPVTSREAAQSEAGKKFWDNVVSRVAVALRLGKGALELADAARKFLE
jgi:hypothetical protein